MDDTDANAPLALPYLPTVGTTAPAAPVPGWEPPPSPPPVAPAPAPAPPRRGRRVLGAAAVVVLAVGGGTAGGWWAGRHTAGTAAATPTKASPAVTTVVAPSSTLAPPATAGASAKSDVSELVARALPSIVSISVELASGGAAGTGFVLDTDGHIATNAHVVADAQKISVEYADKTTADATLLGVDRLDDLAVIKVDTPNLVPLVLGDSSTLKMGQTVVAIGNALDLTGGPTATEGIVSALDRTIDTSDGEHLSHLLQTDAAINPGNSGGPLLTLDGKVVGINSAGSTAAQNIGFSIASNNAKPILDQLSQGKSVQRPFLGVSTVAVDATVQAQYTLDIDHGLYVAKVTQGSAAEEAGVKVGDVLVSVNGTATNDNTTLGDVLKTIGIGNVAHLQIHRKDGDVTLDATLKARQA